MGSDICASVNTRNKWIVYFEKGVSDIFSRNRFHENNFYVIPEDESPVFCLLNAASCKGMFI